MEAAKKTHVIELHPKVGYKTFGVQFMMRGVAKETTDVGVSVRNQDSS